MCPGINDGAVLDDTLLGVLDRFPELASVAVVPLGVSRLQHRAGHAAPHRAEAAPRSCDCVEDWQEVFLTVLGRRLVFAADEYYLLAGRPFPAAATYEGFPMHEDGIGMARTFELEFTGQAEEVTGVRAGFFAWADADARGAGTSPTAACAPPRTDCRRQCADASTGGRLRPRRSAPVGVLTGTYGARGPRRRCSPTLGRADVRVVPVENRYFGGNVGVAGLLVGEDLARVLADEPAATGTCSPTCACRRAASSTAPPPRTCPARSRWSPPTASPSRAARGARA